MSAPLGAGGEEYVMRPVRGRDAQKVYRCPGCDHEIPIGQPHVVAWRVGWFDGPDERRHWHTPCWRARRTTRLRRMPARRSKHR